MTQHSDQVIIDFDHGDDGWEVVARHTPEDMILAFSDVSDLVLKERMRDIADAATASVLATFHDLIKDDEKHPEPDLAHEIADAIVNGQGYAEDDAESDRRAAEVERITSIVRGVLAADANS